MITPAFATTATERILPKVEFDFTTAVLDPRVTFTRTGDTATVTNSSGVIVAAAANVPRFDYDPVTLVCKGLLIEEARTNVLLNSLLNGTSLSTQSVTVTAAARTLSFYGTGQIVLSGAHSATVTGLGAYPTRTALTFTPTAGTLTLTVTGTVQFAQLETGTFASSFIPTDSTAGGITRNIDNASVTGTNFSDWFNASEGAFVFQGSMKNIVSTTMLSISNNTTSGELYQLNLTSGGSTRFAANAGGVAQASIQPGVSVTANTDFSMTAAYKLNSFAAAANGSAAGTDTSGAVAAPTVMYFLKSGTGVSGSSGHVKKFRYWPQRIINAEAQAFSK